MRAQDLALLTPADRRKVAILFSGMKTARPVTNFVRVLRSKFASTPLGYGTGPSRFSAVPVPGAAMPFGVIYCAGDLATGCYETVVRDRFDINPVRILRQGDYQGWSAVNISTQPGTSLMLIDLTRGNAARHGVPSDVPRYSHHTDGQYFSAFVNAELPDVDGILYASRFTEVLSLAIYDRAIPKLAVSGSAIPLTKPLVSSNLGVWNIQVK